MTKLNPDNVCSNLADAKVDKLPTLEQMFKLQHQLQQFLADQGKALDLNESTFEQRVIECLKQSTYINMEIAEILERLPFKRWKSYTDEEKRGFTSDEQQSEVYFELIDVFHFFMNMCILLGLDAKTFRKYYYLKNKENFDRQKRGY